MKKKNKIILSSLAVLAPAAAGLVLWDRLPEVMTTHWGLSGEPNGFMSKPAVVFGLPALMLALHWICVFAASRDRNQKNLSEKMQALLLWIIPAVSMLTSAVTYASALGRKWNVGVLVMFPLGLMFAGIGNYLPKCGQNHTVGLRLKWTLADSENWNSTHRFAGKLMTAGGILISVTSPFALISPLAVFLLDMAVIFCMTIIPCVYSWRYFKTHGEGKQ